MVKFGLVGKSLGHSFSRAYFTEKFERLQLDDHQYNNYELADIKAFHQLLALEPELRGLNVTIPYKVEIMAYLDQLDEGARGVGAVNTVSFAGGKTKGHNTDVVGFELSLKPFLGVLQACEPALIIGTGGAAKAVAWVLAKASMPYLFVSRRPIEGQLSYEALKQLDWHRPRLIVNTSPLGMYPDLDRMPALPINKLGAQHVVIDLIYNPAQTLLLRRAAAQGAQTCSGLSMLHGQAEAAWSIWTQTIFPADEGEHSTGAQ